MPDAIELELPEDPATLTVEQKLNGQGGGEGDPKQAANGGNHAINADEILALKTELEAAKADRNRADSARQSAETARIDSERTSRVERQTELQQRLTEHASTLTTALASAQSEIETAQALSAKAMEEGKWVEASQANRTMAKAEARYLELQGEKSRLDGAIEQAKKAPAQPTAQRTKTQTWIDSHPRFNNDPQYNAKAMKAHYAAIEEGVAIESDDYFKRIEEATGDRQKVEPKVAAQAKVEGGEGDSVAAQSDGVNRQAGPAPVTRRSGGGEPSGGGPKKITLSGEEREAADSLFGDATQPLMYIKDPKERYVYWYQNKEKVKADGRIT